MILSGGLIPVCREHSKSPERGRELAWHIDARLRMVVRGIRVTTRVAETSLPDKDNLPILGSLLFFQRFRALHWVVKASAAIALQVQCHVGIAHLFELCGNF